MKIPIDPNLHNLQKVDIRELHSLQGGLKKLHTESYFRLRNSLEIYGFFIPFFVWKNPKDNLFYYADGHQRDKVIKGEDGAAAYLPESEWQRFKSFESEKERIDYLKTIPESFLSFEFPCLMVEAKNKSEARQKLLLISSQYGKIQKKEFLEFSKELDGGMIFNTVELSEINLSILDDFGKKEEKEPNPDYLPFIKEGDIIQIETTRNIHRLVCGNCLIQEDVEKLMKGELADMVFTDPPYNISIKDLGSGGSKLDPKRSSKGITNHDEFAMASGEMEKPEFEKFLTSIFSSLIENSKDGSIHYICMDWRNLDSVSSAGKLYKELKNVCVWNKDNAGMGSFYRSKHEFVFTFKNGNTNLSGLFNSLKSKAMNWLVTIFDDLKNSFVSETDKNPIFYFDAHSLFFVFKSGTKSHTNNFELGQHGRSRTNVWEYPMVNSFSNNKGKAHTKLHPTVKPFDLVHDCVLDCSKEGDIIADFFGGSGTTLLACEKSNRNARLMEISTKFCDVTLYRFITEMSELKGWYTIKVNGEEMQQADYLELMERFDHEV